MKITGAQIRIARAILKWRVDDLSKQVNLTWARIQQMERSDELISDTSKTDKIISVFKSNGIEFIEENEYQHAGVIRKK